MHYFYTFHFAILQEKVTALQVLIKTHVFWGGFVCAYHTAAQGWNAFFNLYY